MDIGIGFGETLLIVILILVFFGSEKLPSVMRELGRLTAVLRARTNEFMTEIQRASVATEQEAVDAMQEKKASLRKAMLSLRRDQTHGDVITKSGAIRERLVQSEKWTQATSIFIYLSLPEEVRTDELIEGALAQGKRVAVPTLIPVFGTMDACEIVDLKETEPGPMGIRKPKPDCARRFFKSDIDLVVCPGVAFDERGGRLGFGKAYYDRYLRELHGKVPIVGLAFDFQISAEPLPFSQQDIPVDLVFTETRVVGART